MHCQPRVIIFCYIAYVNPSKRFGLFAGEPFRPRRVRPDGTPVLTAGECIGSYGGLVCDTDEALDRDGVYTYDEPALPATARTQSMYVNTHLEMGVLRHITGYASVALTPASCALGMESRRTRAATRMSSWMVPSQCMIKSCKMTGQHGGARGWL